MRIESYMSDQDELKPTSAIVIYSGRSETIATIHKIIEAPDGGAPMLDSGSGMSREMLADMTERFRPGPTGGRSLLPECVIMAEDSGMIWWRPSARRPIFFQTKGAAGALNAQIALYPALLFIGLSSKLHVFALADNKRPTPDTPLFRAPFYNLYGNGSLCSGDVPLPNRPFPTEETIALYERAFYESSFTHTNFGDAQLTKHVGGHTGLWAQMIATPHTVFNPHNLVIHETAGRQTTVSDLLDTK